MNGSFDAGKELYVNSTIPVVIFSGEMEIVWHNNSFSSLFNKKNLVEKNLSAVIQFPLKEKLFNARGNSGRFQVTIIPENSRSSVVTLLVFPFKKNENFPELFIGYLDDITKERNMMLRKTYIGLLEASKLKDDDTGNHIKRVGAYARRLSEECRESGKYPQITPDFIDNIHFIAPMHDVGKIGTPDEILTKRGPLTDSEWVIMKQHTINGALILSNYPDIMASEIARSHHERWDGTGYLYGLEGEDIPLSARITAIADVYDALRMKRSYKEAFSHEKSLGIIKEESGSHFDPNLVEIFISIQDSFKNIYSALADDSHDFKNEDIEDLPVYVEDYLEESSSDAEEVEEVEVPEELEEL